MKNNMFRYSLAIVSFVLVLQACGSKVERPDTLVPEATMQSVMIDLYLLEGAASVKMMPIGDPSKEPHYNLILNKHKISLAQFDSTMIWYSKHLDLLDKMHKVVLDSLEAREKALN